MKLNEQVMPTPQRPFTHITSRHLQQIQRPLGDLCFDVHMQAKPLNHMPETDMRTLQ